MLTIAAQNAIQFAANTQRVLKTLTSREENLVKMYWLEEKSKEEIAVHFKVSVTTISRWMDNATDKLNNPKRLKILYDGIYCLSEWKER